MTPIGIVFCVKDARYQDGVRNNSEFRDETYNPPKNDEVLFEQSGEDDR